MTGLEHATWLVFFITVRPDVCGSQQVLQIYVYFIQWINCHYGLGYDGETKSWRKPKQKRRNNSATTIVIDKRTPAFDF